MQCGTGLRRGTLLAGLAWVVGSAATGKSGEGVRVAWFNGSFMPEEDVRLSIEDRAFKYGDMVFDVCRTFVGRPFKLDRHVERLFDSLKYARIDPGLSESEFVELSLEVLERNASLLGPNDDYWLRQYVSRGLDALSHQALDAGPPTVLIRCEPLDFRPMARGYRDGVKLATPSVRKAHAECGDPKAKHSNYMNLIIGDLETPVGYLSLLLDVDGYVAEGFGWNFFMVKHGVLRTPPLGSILPGISRETVIELCAEERIPFSDAPITLHDIYTAEEAFLTSTSFSILPATSLNDVPIGDGKIPGPITGRLLKAWFDLVGLDFVSQALTRLEAPTLA